MLVALGLAGPDARGVNASLEGRALAALTVPLDGPPDVLEQPPNPGDHHVAGAELRLGVTGLENPGGHRSARNFKGDLVDVAPAPRLAGLGRPYDRVAALAGVGARVAVGRGVAATDMAAAEAGA